MLRNAKELEHYELRARDGNVGHVEDVFFDDQRWTVRYFVVNTGGWLNRRKVLIAPAAVTAPDWNERVLPVDLTREQVEQSPELDPQTPISREYEAALAQYYSWPAYWGAAGFPDVGFAMPMVPLDLTGAGGPDDPTLAARSAKPAMPGTVRDDHHMRSMRAVTGHAVEATDGEIGHVDDFLIDDRSWEIRYLIVDTRNFWPGRKVLIAPQWIDSVGWDEAKVYVQLTREAIKASPAYDPAKPPSGDYTDQLQVHYYGRPRPGA